MSDIQFIDDIYEVSIGHNPKEDIRYTVGRVYKVGPKQVEVTAIIYDLNSYFTHGERRIYIYGKSGSTEDFIWKILEGQPCTITRKL
jgi:hypothetical protein